MKLLNLLLASFLALAITSTSLMADASRGQKVFIKFLKEPCGMDGAIFALKHTQDEWRQIKADGKAEAEIMKFCPNYVEGSVKERLLDSVMDFSIEFASDSGNVPAC
ncbi:cytochrome C [Aliarcobacter thereius]|uniref:cytochrome C n=1 Tax=Aliarcobacter thereius TaxID=544718 RepID=UPI0010FEFDF8|nr:cytochrome C [Aliarcobacter thereius]TLT07850.1 cytochrome C [Aliarcobacter thereius]